MDTSGYESESVHLQRLLPEEMWLHVLKNVQNPDHLAALSNSSSYLRQLLAPRKTEFLFNGVWKVFTQRLEDNYPASNSNSIHRHCEVTDKVNKGWMRNITPLRQVCKEWCNVIDSYFREHTLHFSSEENQLTVSPEIRKFIRRNCYLTNGRQFGRSIRFLRHFQTTHQGTDRNPIVGNSVEISIVTGRPVFLEMGVLNVLERYGPHFLYCSIEVVSAYSRPEMYTRLWSIMSLLPNIQVLRINNFKRRMGITARELAHFRALLTHNPLPTLNNLEMITTRYLVPDMVNELMRSNSQVRSLVITPPNIYYRDNLFNQALPRLSSLSLCLTKPDTINDMYSSTLLWTLKELTLDMSLSITFTPWPMVFRVLNEKFKRTLTTLKLKLPEAKLPQEKDALFRNSHLMRLDLPLLEHLELQFKNVANLDFILASAQSLKTFNLEIRLENASEVVEPLSRIESGEDKKLRLLSCLDDLNATNIWSMCPQLSSLYVTIYSRRGIEFNWHAWRN